MSQSSRLPPGFSVAKAHEAQKRLCAKIVQEDGLPSKIQLVAGVDVAYLDDRAVGAAVVLDYESLQLVESATATVYVGFPYIPTLLAFRELPAALAAIKRLKMHPDVFLVDAHGLAHPFGCGFASHLGLAVGKPTVGVAKSRLVGEPEKIDGETFLVHEGKVVGAVLTTKESVKPVYVSVGHLVSLRTAIKIVEHCTRCGRIPEPLLAAHRMASEKRHEALSTSSGNSLEREAYERRNRGPTEERPERRD
jgi:deoxyribonuclease V